MAEEKNNEGKEETDGKNPCRCPDCGAKLIFQEGCRLCPICGYCGCE